MQIDMENDPYYISLWIKIFKLYYLNSMFGKTSCVMNAYITDKTGICKVCFIHMVLLGG